MSKNSCPDIGTLLFSVVETDVVAGAKPPEVVVPVVDNEECKFQ